MSCYGSGSGSGLHEKTGELKKHNLSWQLVSSHQIGKMESLELLAEASANAPPAKRKKKTEHKRECTFQSMEQLESIEAVLLSTPAIQQLRERSTGRPPSVWSALMRCLDPAAPLLVLQPPAAAASPAAAPPAAAPPAAAAPSDRSVKHKWGGPPSTVQMAPQATKL
jgi:hypothetical protein